MSLSAGVVSCGNGWFSKITDGYVNATKICRDQGYDLEIVEYGGNHGTECRHSNNTGGGSLTKLGFHVSWKCEGARGKFQQVITNISKVLF